MSTLGTTPLYNPSIPSVLVMERIAAMRLRCSVARDPLYSMRVFTKVSGLRIAVAMARDSPVKKDGKRKPEEEGTWEKERSMGSSSRSLLGYCISAFAYATFFYCTLLV